MYKNYNFLNLPIFFANLVSILTRDPLVMLLFSIYSISYMQSTWKPPSDQDTWHTVTIKCVWYHIRFSKKSKLHALFTYYHTYVPIFFFNIFNRPIAISYVALFRMLKSWNTIYHLFHLIYKEFIVSLPSYIIRWGVFKCKVSWDDFHVTSNSTFWVIIYFFKKLLCLKKKKQLASHIIEML